jgi:hypothetical protein
VVLGALLLAVGWALLAGWLLRQAGDAARQGRSDLRAVRRGATPTSLLDPATRTRLRAADHHFDRARSRLRSPVLTPLRLVPGVRGQIQAADRLVNAARGATDLASVAVEDLHDLADRPLPAGPARVAALEDLADIVARVETGLGRLDPGSPGGLVGPLGDQVRDLRTERDDARASLGRAEHATRAAARLVAGPSNYLLVGSNNAEMRAGGGMYLSVAPLRISAGRLALGDVHPTAPLSLPPGAVRVAGDLVDNWPLVAHGRDLRQLGLTADFPVNAAIVRDFWARSPEGGPVEGVVGVDVDALRALLRVVGPVEVRGVEYTATSVRGELLRDQYRRFAGDKQERRDQLGEVARAVFTRIEGGQWQLDELATAMVEIVQGRHLVVWSADPDTQEAWADAGADGRLRPDTVSADLVNTGSNKLDSFVPTTATLTSPRRPDGRVAVEIRYEMTSKAPDSGPAYLRGPNVDGLVAGQYRGVVLVNLPRGATAVRAEGGTVAVAGHDGATEVVGVDVSLLAGESKVVTVSAVLPERVRSVVLEPSARIPRTTWIVDGKKVKGAARRSVPVGSAGD